ncbi:MAG: thymidylate kinase [Verrucomicrobia bacterium]|nr:thymidylate kinase [Verrucomicrobiota bacterium]
MPKLDSTKRTAGAVPESTFKLRPGRKRRVLVPQPSEKRFYGHGIPGVDARNLRGKLIVVEGADGSGRSTQIARLVNWLEGNGHATIQVGLKRSTLVSEELEQAKRGNILSRTTLSLFYATDFADQLENAILPALRAGFLVMADRYIYTLMARDMVRGMDEAWLKNVYGLALVPDAVFYLSVSPEQLVQRNFAKDYALDYWESGMDLGLKRELFDSFLEYQALMAKQFQRLQATYGFTIVNGNRSADEITLELRHKIETVLAGKTAGPL